MCRVCARTEGQDRHSYWTLETDVAVCLPVSDNVQKVPIFVLILFSTVYCKVMITTYVFVYRNVIYIFYMSLLGLLSLLLFLLLFAFYHW